jgi:hypothetical protein
VVDVRLNGLRAVLDVMISWLSSDVYRETDDLEVA